LISFCKVAFENRSSLVVRLSCLSPGRRERVNRC